MAKTEKLTTKADAAKPADKPAVARAASESSAQPVAGKAAKPVAKIDSKKKANLPGNMFPGGIDTGLAASSAASMLFARRKGRDQLGSTSISQIKNDLNKNPSSVAGDFLDQHGGAQPGKRHGGPTKFGPQSAHNQTFGSDANRNSVPRRTSSG